MKDSGYKLTVTQLNEYVNGMFKSDALLRNVCVCGELSGFKRHSSGHLYFAVKDAGALVRCVMFRQNAYSLDFSPQDGQSVIIRGSVSLYVRDGQYQLYVESMEQEGEGELYRRFLLLKTRLEARGYFDPARKKGIPVLPRCIGVVTSPTGAAVQDIINITRRRFPGMNILLCPVRVQGEGAAQEIAEAIYQMNALARADVLIVGRGGGSLEDLWPFNEETVARAIYESDIPVVSAVGHETDFTIADFVADLRAPTPSAAAELCVPEYQALREGIVAMGNAIASYCRDNMKSHRRELEGIRDSAAFVRARHSIELSQREVLAGLARIKGEVRAAAANALHSVEQRKAELDALSPKGVLSRGYGMIRTREGYAGGVRALKAGQEASLVMADGTAGITVNSIDIAKEG